MITAARLRNVDDWMIKKLNEKHTCHVGYTKWGDDFVLTSKAIADFILPKIQIELEYYIKLVQQDVNKQWGIHVSYKNVWYSWDKSLEIMYGKWDKSYNQLPQMLKALQQTNLDMIVD